MYVWEANLKTILRAFLTAVASCVRKKNFTPEWNLLVKKSFPNLSVSAILKSTEYGFHLQLSLHTDDIVMGDMTLQQPLWGGTVRNTLRNAPEINLNLILLLSYPLSLSKLSILNGADVFINCRCCDKAYLQQKDIDLLGLTDLLDVGSTSQSRHWLEFNFKTKSAITLTRSDEPPAKVSKIVDDDDKTVKNLWTELDKAHCTSKTQMVTNFQGDLSTTTFDREEKWDKHMEKFHHLVEKLTF